MPTETEKQTETETETEAETEPVTIDTLPDDVVQQLIAACSFSYPLLLPVPLFNIVKGLGCVSKGMRQQLHRLQPLVGVWSLAVMQRPAHGPWCITLRCCTKAH